MSGVALYVVPPARLIPPRPPEVLPPTPPEPATKEKRSPSTSESTPQAPKIEEVQMPSLNARFTALRFFEGHSCDKLPPERRVYRQRFAKVITRDIFTEITLEYSKREQRLDFTIQAVYQHKTPEGGNVVNRPELRTYLPADSQKSLHAFRSDEGKSLCCGRVCVYESDPRPLGGWSVGLYIVDVYINGEKGNSGSFEIHE